MFGSFATGWTKTRPSWILTNRGILILQLVTLPRRLFGQPSFCLRAVPVDGLEGTLKVLGGLLVNNESAP